MFWLDDFRAFATDYDNYYKILPMRDMSLEEQLNSIMRLSLVLSMVLYAVNRGDLNMFGIVLFAAFFTVIVYSYASKKENEKEKLLDDLNIEDTRYQGKCVMPTRDNPTMNILPTDYKYFPNRPPACDTTMNRHAKESMDKYLNEDGDQSAHNFYTMPCTVIPDNRDLFAKAMFS